MSLTRTLLFGIILGLAYVALCFWPLAAAGHPVSPVGMCVIGDSLAVPGGWASKLSPLVADVRALGNPGTLSVNYVGYDYTANCGPGYSEALAVNVGTNDRHPYWDISEWQYFLNTLTIAQEALAYGFGSVILIIPEPYASGTMMPVICPGGASEIAGLTCIYQPDLLTDIACHYDIPGTAGFGVHPSEESGAGLEAAKVMSILVFE